MSVMVVNSADLGNPYECPLCWRLFYFENDYVKHKCSAAKDNRGRRPKWMDINVLKKIRGKSKRY